MKKQDGDEVAGVTADDQALADLKAVDQPKAPELSPEDEELQQLEAALAAEQAGNALPKTEAQPLSEAVDAEPTDPKAGDSPASTGKSEAAGLKAAVKRLREKNRSSELLAARLQGQVEALQAIAKTGNQTAAAEPELTPAQRIQSIREDRKNLAAQFDTGEITAATWEENRQALEDQEIEIRESLRKPAPTAVQMNDLGLEEHAVKLEQDYPVLNKLNENQVRIFERRVREDAELAGESMPGGPVGTKILRERIAIAATKHFGLPLPGQNTETPPASKPVLSATAQARDQKLAAARAAPPDVGRMGGPGKAGELSESDLESQLDSLSEDDQISLLSSMPGLVRKITAGGIG